MKKFFLSIFCLLSISCSYDNSYMRQCTDRESIDHEGSLFSFEYVSEVFSEYFFETKHTISVSPCYLHCDYNYQKFTSVSSLYQQKKDNQYKDFFSLLKDGYRVPNEICLKTQISCENNVGTKGVRRIKSDLNFSALFSESLPEIKNKTLRDLATYGDCSVSDEVVTTPVVCGAGYSLNSSTSQCVLDQIPCPGADLTTLNASSGVQNWNSSLQSYGDCQIDACIPGFSLSANICSPVVDPCITNPQSSPTCPGYDICIDNPMTPGCAGFCIMDPMEPGCPAYCTMNPSDPLCL